MEISKVHTANLPTINKCSRHISCGRKLSGKVDLTPHLRYSKKNRYKKTRHSPNSALNLTSPTVYHTSQSTTLRYSPARLTLMLERQESTQRKQNELACDMVLHVNDYCYEKYQGHGRLRGTAPKLVGDADSYEESSGYSSSHVHVRSCQDVADSPTNGQREYSVWEHHNSC